MRRKNFWTFLGNKCNNINVREMILFFGRMMIISMEHRNVVGYISYFVNNNTINIGGHYAVHLCGYDTWAIDIMSLIIYTQISWYIIQSLVINKSKQVVSAARCATSFRDPMNKKNHLCIWFIV